VNFTKIYPCFGCADVTQNVDMRSSKNSRLQQTTEASGVRRKFPRRGQSFVTIVWRHKSTLGEVPKARPF